MPSVLAHLPADVLSFALRVARARRSVGRVKRLPQVGVCASCGLRSYFVLDANGWLLDRMRSWPYDGGTLDALATRENYFCLWCGRSYRLRTLAAVAGRWLRGARVYEPAVFGAFSRRTMRRAASFITSEFLDGAEPGEVADGRRHEDIRSLSFANASFDLVITSEVFEHVADPWPGFAEVRRVLRPGGRHVFTVPVVRGRPTSSRDGQPAVYHIDPLRPRGSLVETDFGDDLPDLLRDHGFDTAVHDFPRGEPVARVFESVAL